MNWDELFRYDDINRLLLSLLIGGIVGIEREYRSKSAGFRTMTLVCMGASLFTILSLKIGAPNSADRIAANIVTGIGFLGAGVIFKESDKVTGITTATTIWMVASLGMAVGAGHYVLGFVAMGCVLFVLTLLRYFQSVIENLNQIRDYRISYENRPEIVYQYEKLFIENGLKPIRSSHTKIDNRITGRWTLQGSASDHRKLIKTLLNDPTIQELDF